MWLLSVSRTSSHARATAIAVGLGFGVGIGAAAVFGIPARRRIRMEHQPTFDQTAYTTPSTGWRWWQHPSATSTTRSSCDCGHSRNFIADAVDNVLDSVVNILMETEQSGLFSSKLICSRGSGFFVSEDGKILTNAHVVQDYAENSKIIVTTSDGLEYDARIFAVDFMSDLAVIEVLPTAGTTLPSWKPCPARRAGEWVVSIGNPFGLQHTITAGVVSSQRRKSAEIGGRDWRVEYIQTDCVVHTGSSGGPLINLDGEVIGINTIRADKEGISFAIKIRHSMEMIQQLMQVGKIIRPWFGFAVVSLSPSVWQRLRSKTPPHLLPKTDAGVLITSVDPGSPAANAGCVAGDVIVEANKTAVVSASQLLKVVGLDVHGPVHLKIHRKVATEVDGVIHYEPTDIDVLVHPQAV
ncbi:Serine protease htra2, mitochondrial [Entophlyctis sp. JEL0112]|nr:Serine protease htra2, mitochondrial [Entophlyctis sp. JEL0112]